MFTCIMYIVQYPSPADGGYFVVYDKGTGYVTYHMYG
jgi:hypothetical protein